MSVTKEEARQMSDQCLKNYLETAKAELREASATFNALEYEDNRRSSEDCEHCKDGKLIGQGGGVKCDTCTYWFCY